MLCIKHHKNTVFQCIITFLLLVYASLFKNQVEFDNYSTIKAAFFLSAKIGGVVKRSFAGDIV
jgi:hypothetical protein